MVALLWIWSRNMGAAARFDARFWTRVPRIFAASAIMGVALFGAAHLMAPLLAMGGVKYLALLALVILGCVIYFGGGHVIGAFRLGDFKSALRRGGRG
jgi:putative peptidoglycan lipid II flippase